MFRTGLRLPGQFPLMRRYGLGPPAKRGRTAAATQCRETLWTLSCRADFDHHGTARGDGEPQFETAIVPLSLGVADGR